MSATVIQLSIYFKSRELNVKFINKICIGTIFKLTFTLKLLSVHLLLTTPSTQLILAYFNQNQCSIDNSRFSLELIKITYIQRPSDSYKYTAHTSSSPFSLNNPPGHRYKP